MRELRAARSAHDLAQPLHGEMRDEALDLGRVRAGVGARVRVRVRVGVRVRLRLRLRLSVMVRVGVGPSSPPAVRGSSP